MSYQCPLCQQLLTRHGQSYCCLLNHQFDVAKEGYVNLMPAQHKRSKDPGDSKEMMLARRQFLAAGHYDQMRQRVAKLAVQYLHNTQYQLLDIGCGEGYYTNEIAEQLAQQSKLAKVYGLDIAKIAIKFAAKRYSLCDFSVASSHRLPFVDNAFDGIVRIYAPCKAEELYRCCRDGGVVITVTPAAHHLNQIKALIYDKVQLHQEAVEQIEGFCLEHQEKLSYRMSLSGKEAGELLQMTPFAWRASDEIHHQLQSMETFVCDADFIISVYRKMPKR